MSYNIEVQGGSTVRLPTKGKYCDRDIVVTALGGGGDTPGVIKAGTYIPGETFEPINLSMDIHFACNGVEYNKLECWASARLSDVSYYGDNGSLYAGDSGNFIDRSPIVILEDFDARSLSNYPAEYDWFMAHYTLQSGIIVSGTIDITTNGIHDVAEFEKANVQVSGGDRTMEDGLVGRTLTEYINDTADTIGTYAFAYYSSLEYVSMPNATTISGGNNFLSCSKLKRVDIPNLKNAVSNSGNHFRNCTALEELRVPLLNTVLSVGSCTALRVYELGTPYSISASAFANLTALEVLVMHCTKVVPLSNINAFTGTRFASGGTGGKVYVPQQYIEGYKTATNWSSLYAAGTCEFIAIEGSEYE